MQREWYVAIGEWPIRNTGHVYAAVRDGTTSHFSCVQKLILDDKVVSGANLEPLPLNRMTRDVIH